MNRNTVGISLNSRQEIAVRRIAQYCNSNEKWGFMLFHKVGTGKTITSLMAAMNSTKEDIIKILIIAPPGIFDGNFKSEFKKISGEATYNSAHKEGNVTTMTFGKRTVLLEDYPFDKLVEDINNRELREFTDQIVIIDEAHRLLNKDIYDSVQAGSLTPKHSLESDIYFKNKIYKAKKCIIMTGTPLQESMSDICKLINFIGKTNKFTVEKYAFKTVKSSAFIGILKLCNNFIRSNGYTMIEKVIAPAVLGNIVLPIGSAITSIGSSIPSILFLAQGFNSMLSYINVDSGNFITMIFIFATIICIIEPLFKKKNKAGTANKELIKSGGSRVTTKKNKYLSHTKRKKTRNHLKSKKTKFTKKNISKKKQGGANPFTLYDFAKQIFSSWGVPMTEKFFYETFILSSYMSTVIDMIELEQENDYHIESLASDISEYVSLYDYQVQDGLTKIKKGVLVDDLFQLTEESKPIKIDTKNIYTNKEVYTNKEDLRNKINVNLNDVYPTEDDKKNFPEEINFQVSPEYDEYQKKLLETLFIGEPNNVIKDVLNRDMFKAASTDVGSTIKDTLKNSRMVGNFSQHVELYYTVLNRMKDKYDTYKREDGTMMSYNNVPYFSCLKFVNILEKLLLFSTGKFPDGKDQPHNKEGKYYLPLVYSYTENNGLSLFAAFLSSKGYNYILVHPGQERISTLSFQRKRALEYTYPISISQDVFNKEQPLCILLHSSMTEGFDAKYNPSIFVMEPCNIYGDQEQVYGRVLRKYGPLDLTNIAMSQNTTPNSPTYKRPEKYIYQYICITSSDCIKLGVKQKSSMITKKIDGLTGKMSILGITPEEVIGMFKRLKFESPDIYQIQRLIREKKRLIDLETKIMYGPLYSDIIESKQCDNNKDANNKYKECNILNGEGCAQYGGEQGEIPVVLMDDTNVDIDKGEGEGFNLDLESRRHIDENTLRILESLEKYMARLDLNLKHDEERKDMFLNLLAEEEKIKKMITANASEIGLPETNLAG